MLAQHDQRHDQIRADGRVLEPVVHEAAPIHRHVQRLERLDGLGAERRAEREHDFQHAVGLHEALDRPLEHNNVAGLGGDCPQLRNHGLVRVVLDNPLRPVGVGSLGQSMLGSTEMYEKLSNSNANASCTLSAPGNTISFLPEVVGRLSGHNCPSNNIHFVGV